MSQLAYNAFEDYMFSMVAFITIHCFVCSRW